MTYLRGMLSLIRPRNRVVMYDVSDLQREIWQAVGDSLRFAMNAYEETQEYKIAIKEYKPAAKAISQTESSSISARTT